jgi:hypothetical protein
VKNITGLYIKHSTNTLKYLIPKMLWERWQCHTITPKHFITIPKHNPRQAPLPDRSGVIFTIPAILKN